MIPKIEKMLSVEELKKSLVQNVGDGCTDFTDFHLIFTDFWNPNP
jgi:hypothetical protein